jgi:hypothetical protein
MHSLGKSVLASYVVNFARTEPTTLIISYICSFSQERRSGSLCARIVRYVIARLLRSHQYLLPYVYETYISKGIRAPPQIPKALLLDLLTVIETTLFVIDGLDECEESDQRGVLTELLDLVNSSKKGLRILFFSRESRDIKRKLDKVPQISLSDEETSMSEDIELFTKASLLELRQRFEEHIIDAIEQVLIRKANGTLFSQPPCSMAYPDTLPGMFLWIRLVVANLDQQESIRDLEEAAERLPDDLHTA